MNAKIEEQRPETVTVEIDGVEIEAPKGSTIIKIADDHGFDIPRFCYHRKLTAPANCRMCLVDVEMGGKPAPKPLPACATAVGDGMVVRTHSERALKAQKGVMEFLLINHPLDCPICDQGGECELQDLAMGYGRGVSRFSERKRVVQDENLGPLVSTDMTRCIHCTRCVRFLDEIAGQAELGALYRGEHMEIGTYVGDGVNSELSGNIIDLCPVGALTSKPYRYRARAWEMLSHPGVGPHDAVGSNISIHQIQGRVKRIVPRDNEAVNETWIADRDRYSYQGVYADDRLEQPLLKRDGIWEGVDWQEALEACAEGLRGTVSAHGVDQLGALVSPSATLEEMYLLGRLMRGLGSDHIDHRLRQADFRDDADAPAYPYLGLPLADVERLDAALLIGAHTRHEQPLLNHRLRKAALAGGQVIAVNPRRFDWNFPLLAEHAAAPQALVAELAGIAEALVAEKGGERPQGLDRFSAGREANEAHRNTAKALLGAKRPAVFVGTLAQAHPAGAELRALAALIAQLVGASYGVLSDGANGAGGWLAGAVPGRRAGGASGSGLDARAMLESPREGYVLFNVEPEYDCWDGVTAQRALQSAEFVVVMSSWATDAMRTYADVILPVGAFTETAGTFVNAAGRWQIFGGVGKPVGEARPAWRVLRVLGNLLELDGFDYEAPDQIHHEVRTLVGELDEPQAPAWDGEALEPVTLDGDLIRTGGAAIYRVDPLVRRATALQQTPLNAAATVAIAPATAESLGVAVDDWVALHQNGERIRLPVAIDEAIPVGTAWVAAGLADSAGLGPMVGAITLERV